MKVLIIGAGNVATVLGRLIKAAHHDIVQVVSRSINSAEILANELGCSAAANFGEMKKDADLYIRFLFITGISKFTKVSLFSKLNNLDDLTIDVNYATMLGYTQHELEHYFVDYIDEILADFSEYTRPELLEEIRLWYN